MKTRAIKICAVLGLLIGLTTSARAQMTAQFRAHIPFDFNVGGQSFRAGDYMLNSTNSASDGSALTIREAESGEAKIFWITSKDVNSRLEVSNLVFRRYGERYYLAEIISPTLNAQFRRMRTERRLARAQRLNRETVAMLK